MFNGIIEHTGIITSLKRTEGGGANLILDVGGLASQLKAGFSIAVDGVCLTVIKKKGKQIQIDVSEETWQRTNLLHCSKASSVNLEMPVRVGDLVSGHFVQGHVEGLARVTGWKRRGPNDVRLCLELTPDLLQFCATKGSIALNGVSLTVASLRGEKIEIALIPYTLEHTNLGELQPGDFVNVETDIIGRYVVSALKKAYHKSK